MIRVPINRLRFTMFEMEKDIRNGSFLLCLHVSVPEDALRQRLTGHSGLVVGYVEPQVTDYEWSPYRLCDDRELAERCARMVGGALKHGGVWRPAFYRHDNPTGFVFESMGSRGLNTFAAIKFGYREIDRAMDDGHIPVPLECVASHEPINPGERQRRLTEAPETVDTVRNRRARTFG